MSVKTYKTVCREWHADVASPDDFANSGGGNTVDKDGYKLTAAAASSYFYHFGDSLLLDIDRLHSIEFLYRMTGMVSAAQTLYLGVGTSYNANPELIASHCFIKSDASETSAGSGEYRLRAISDDGTVDVSPQDMEFNIKNGEWYRVKMGFKDKVTSISHLGSTKGKSNIQVKLSDSRGFARRPHPQLRGTNLSMNGYTGGVQPIFGLVTNGSGAVLTVKEVIAEFEQVG